MLSLFISADTKLHVPTDDDFLIMFLRPCKYYANSAYKRVRPYHIHIFTARSVRMNANLIVLLHFQLQIKTFYKIKANHSIFEDLRPITVRHVYEQELVKLIPTRDNFGRRALWIESGSMAGRAIYIECMHLGEGRPNLIVAQNDCFVSQKDGSHRSAASTICSGPFKWPSRHR